MDFSTKLIIFIGIINTILIVVVLIRHASKSAGGLLKNEFENINKNFLQVDRSVRDEFSRNREETNKSTKDNREELTKSLNTFGDQFSKNTKELNELLRQKFKDFSKQQSDINKQTTDNVKEVKDSVEKQLKAIREDNTKQLDEMRKTVDEKLHKTLEERLGQSFKIVGERLEQVHKGLGEMQNLASGVGDLKKVLSNVKTRGTMGEIQLGAIIEQLLSPEQYATNVSTKKGSRENVEFAIKLPGKDESGEIVWLPIDSKFPLEVYHALIDAYEAGDVEIIEKAGKALEGTIKKCAKDIHNKYVDPPNTTDFAIMFLPFEGLYAEVMRRPILFQSLQREFKMTITGPSTLGAFLNSLQMGFRTLAIDKRSSEVWKVLGAIKTEFGKFGTVLEKAQQRIRQADTELDNLLKTRTNQINRKLKSIEELPTDESARLLGDNNSVDSTENLIDE